MTAEAFTEELKRALGDRLTMVALFGAESGLEAAVELMVVCDRLGRGELDAIAAPARAWSKLGNPAPLLFALDRLMNSSHVFPMELLDIKENHRVLFGRDVLRDLPISQANLCFQLEHELKGSLIRLREGYLQAARDADAVLALMLDSLPGFQSTLKAALRFYEVRVPSHRADAVAQLGKHVAFDLSVFASLHAIKEGKELAPLGEGGVIELFERYLETIERSADLISSLGRRR